MHSTSVGVEGVEQGVKDKKKIDEEEVKEEEDKEEEEEEGR